MAFDYVNYDRLEYIESTGAQYIVLGDYFNPATDSFELRASFASTGVNEMILSFGGTTANSGWLYSYASTNKVTLYIYNSSASQIAVDYCGTAKSLTPNNYSFINKRAFFNENISSTAAESHSFSTSPEKMRLFGGSGGYAGSYLTHGRVFFLRHLRNGSLVYSYVGAKRKSDNVIGVYDEVNRVFYTNAGSGSFIGGVR